MFDGADGAQVVLWQCENGGTSPSHVHDFWEYARVVEGTFDGEVEGFLTRISGSSLANVTSGGGQVPAFLVEPK